MPAVCASASGTISTVGNAAIAVAKPKEERSFRREIMTASLRGCPKIEGSFALPVLGLIYVIGQVHSHCINDADLSSECVLFGRWLFASPGVWWRAAAMRNSSTKSGYVSISFMKMNRNSMGRFAPYRTGNPCAPELPSAHLPPQAVS